MPSELHGITGDDLPSSDSECRNVLVRRLTRMREALIQFDHRQRIVYANPAAQRLFGLPDVATRHTLSFVELFEDPVLAEQLLSELHQLNHLHHEPCRLRRTDSGEVVVALVNLAGLYDTGGRLAGFEAYITDITAQRAAEERLRASERRLRTIVNSVTDGLIVVEPDNGRIVFASEAMSQMLGYPADTLTAMNITDMHPPRDRSWVQEDFRNHAAGRRSFTTEVPMQRSDGSTFMADITSSQINLEGRTCLLGVFRDVSERLQAREAEHRATSLLKAVQRIAHLGFCVWDHPERRFNWSEELWRMLGAPPGETGSYRALLRRIPRDDRGRLICVLRIALKGPGRTFELKHRLRARDGTLHMVHTQAEVLTDLRGKVARVLATLLDITAADAAQLRLQSSEARLREFTDIAADWLWELGPDLRVTYVSPNVRELLSVHPENVIGRPCAEAHRSKGVVETPDWHALQEAMDRREPFHELVIHWRPPDSPPRFLSLTGRPRFSEHGRFLGYRGVGREITEKQLTEQHLHRLLEENRWLARSVIAAREQERKRMARELHDELGQLLTAIRLDADCIVALDPESHAGPAVAGDIIELTRRAQGWSRSLTRRLHPLDLDQLGLIDGLDQEIRDWSRRNPAVDCGYVHDGRFDDLDERLLLDLYRIVQESLTNIARHAHAREVRVCLARVAPDPTDDHTEQTSALGTIFLMVRDDGAGLTPSQVRPGLGILGMRERVESRGGTFELLSVPGHGLSVLASLPCETNPPTGADDI